MKNGLEAKHFQTIANAKSAVDVHKSLGNFKELNSALGLPLVNRS